ncbi:hypothetical protein P3L10_000907 [Capsicum annuum]
MANGVNGVEVGGGSTSNAGAITAMDYNHPLFLSLSDVSGTQIISFQLTGVENFFVWFRSMCIALLGRNKLGLVDGFCTKEKYSSELGNH